MEKVCGVVVELWMSNEAGDDGKGLPEGYGRWVTVDVPHLRDCMTMTR